MILSIIIPAYNVEKYIEKCIVSTQKQDLSKKEYEIIIIDDGSPDKSKKIAEIQANLYENIKVFSKENGGLSSARNYGISKAKGEYVFFLDSDDWIDENSLGEIAIQLREEAPDVLCICSANTDGQNHKRRFLFNDTEPKSGLDLLKTGWYIPCAPFYIVKKEMLDKYNLRFYEGILHEDSEYTPRMLYYAKKISFTNRLVYFVYQNPNSITRTVNPKRSIDLLNVVCERLSAFSEVVENDMKSVFDNMISMYINNALSFILDCSKEQQKEINEIFSKKKHLWMHLKNSSINKYRIEYKLFVIFHQNPLLVYKLLKKIS